LAFKSDLTIHHSLIVINVGRGRMRP
jgi:hypothetical protein